jgi:hypothetical protein
MTRSACASSASPIGESVEISSRRYDLSLEFWVLLALAFAPATSAELAATPELAANLA